MRNPVSAKTTMTKLMKLKYIFVSLVFVYLLWYWLRVPQQTLRTDSLGALQNVQDTGDFFGLGSYLLEHNHFSAAISFLQKDRLVHPNSLETAYYLAEAYRQKGMAQKAIATFQEVVALDSVQASSWSLFALEKLGLLFTRHDQLEASRQAYLKALKRESRKEWILKIKNQLAELDLTEGHYKDDGNTVYNERGEVIAGVGPGDMRTNRNFEIARHTDDRRKKEVYFKKAIETDPGMYQAYFDVGLALTKQNRFKEAISYFEKSNKVWQTRTDVNPSGQEKCSAFAYLGLSYLELGHYQKALALCDHALAIDDTYYYAHLFKAQVLLALNRKPEALEILETLLQENPDDEELVSLLGNALL